MSKPTFCAFCGQELDQGQEFLYQVEFEDFVERVGTSVARQAMATFPGTGQEFLNQDEFEDFVERVGPIVALQAMETYPGTPFRMCWECRESVDENRRDRLAEAENERRSTRRYWKILMIATALIIATAVLMSWA